MIVLASEAMPKNTAAVPPKAIAISRGAVREVAQHHADQARQHEPHEEGEAQQQGDAACWSFLKPLIAQEEAKGDAHEQHEADQRVAGEEAEAGCDADPGAQHRRHERQRQQPVGVAQDPVALLGQRDGAAAVDRMPRVSLIAILLLESATLGASGLILVPRFPGFRGSRPRSVRPDPASGSGIRPTVRVSPPKSVLSWTPSPYLSLADVKRIAAASEAEAQAEQVGGRHPPSSTTAATCCGCSGSTARRRSRLRSRPPRRGRPCCRR